MQQVGKIYRERRSPGVVQPSTALRDQQAYSGLE
jgi:hypothetical protein